MPEKKFIQVTNKEMDMRAILDGYHSVIGHPFFLAEALQKDVIQNSWDARIDKNNGKHWKCKFDLFNVGRKNFLTITDEGTKGLIGTQFDTQEELLDILQNKNEDEDLAVFCSSNWSRKKGHAGGNRGRGKVVFIGASRDEKIYFDSYRSSDNRRVMVELYINDNKEIEFKIVWDEEAASKLFKIGENKLLPLDKHGTRIIILNPDHKIVEAMNHGYFLSYIGNAWWEIIKKYDAEIIVKDGFFEKRADYPKWYDENVQNISINNNAIKIFEAEKSLPELISIKILSLKVEKIVLRYSPERDIPMGIKGIAIQRGGMTIERCKTEDLIREQGTGNIYGWIEMNEELSEKIKYNCVGPEHFNFIWSKNPACYLRQYLMVKCRDFAKDLELIESEQAKKNKIQKQASQKATNFLTPLFEKLNLSGGGGSKKIIRIVHERQPNEKLRLSAVDFELPNEKSRVDYNQEIKGVYVLAINEYDRDFFVQVKVWIEAENGREIIISEKEFNLSNSKKIKIGDDFFKVDKQLEKGVYSFKARMLLLEDADINIQVGKNILKAEKSTVLYDRINKKFYVEMDPPETGPFDFQPSPSEDKRLLIWPENNVVDNTLVFYYNSLHPKLIPLIEDREDSEPLAEYLIGQGVMLLYQIKIDSMLAEDDNDSDEDDADLKKIVKSKNIEQVFPYLLRKQSELLWDYLNK